MKKSLTDPQHKTSRAIPEIQEFFYLHNKRVLGQQSVKRAAVLDRNKGGAESQSSPDRVVSDRLGLNTEPTADWHPQKLKREDTSTELMQFQLNYVDNKSNQNRKR